MTMFIMVISYKYIITINSWRPRTGTHRCPSLSGGDAESRSATTHQSLKSADASSTGYTVCTKPFAKPEWFRVKPAKICVTGSLKIDCLKANIDA